MQYGTVETSENLIYGRVEAYTYVYASIYLKLTRNNRGAQISAKVVKIPDPDRDPDQR